MSEMSTHWEGCEEVHPECRAAKLEAENKRLEDELERKTDALQKIADWSDAYPLDVFPEPDFKRVRELLRAGGITVDAVAAANMRYVVEGVGKIAKEALRGAG